MNHREFMSKIGKRGGKSRMQKLTKEERSALSLKASMSRSKKQRQEDGRKGGLAAKKARRAKAKKAKK